MPFRFTFHANAGSSTASSADRPLGADLGTDDDSTVRQSLQTVAKLDPAQKPWKVAVVAPQSVVYGSRTMVGRTRVTVAFLL
jgi:hypothetical protein